MTLSSFFNTMIRDELYAATGTSANVANDTGPGITATELLAKMRSAMEMFAPVPPKVQIMECAHAYTVQRARLYAKRKAKTPAHWRRMDKKWRKRYGFRNVPCVFEVGEGALSLAFGIAGSNQVVYLVHPSLMANFRVN